MSTRVRLAEQVLAERLKRKQGGDPGLSRLLSYEPNNGIADSQHQLFVSHAATQVGDPT